MLQKVLMAAYVGPVSQWRKLWNSFRLIKGLRGSDEWSHLLALRKKLSIMDTVAVLLLQQAKKHPFDGIM